MPATRPDKKAKSETNKAKDTKETSMTSSNQPSTANTTSDPNSAFIPQQQVGGQGGINQFSNNPFTGGQNINAEPGKRAPEDIESLDVLMGVATNLNGDGDTLISFQKAFESSVDKDINISAKLKTEYHIIPLSGASAQLPVDAIIFTRKINKKVYTYTFLLAASLSTTIVRQEYIGGHSHTCSQTVGGLYDDEYYSEVEAIVKKVHGDVDVIEVSSTVLTEDIDHDNAAVISKLKGNCINAINAVVIKDDNAKKISAKWLKDTGGLTHNLVYTKAGATTLSGHPVRTDAIITLSSGASQYNKGAIAGTSRAFARKKGELIQTSVYVELVPQNSQMPGGQNQPFMGYNQQLNNGVYIPRVIMSSIDQKGLASSNSLELTALGIASTFLMDDVYSWAQVFRPSIGDNISHQFHDIGAIGLERSMTGTGDWKPAKIRTNDASFTDQNLLDLLCQFVVPEVVYSLDVDESGPQTWLQSVFARATTDDKAGHEATRDIIRAFDNVTNGQFSVNYKELVTRADQQAPHLIGPIIRRDCERVHLGTYVDDSGRTRDLRDIDTFAILNNVNAGDITPLVNWTATFNPAFGSEVVRMEERERLIKVHLPNANITGMARRITFNRLVMMALANAIQAAQIPFNSEMALQQFNSAGGFGGLNFGGQPSFANAGSFGGFSGQAQAPAYSGGNRMV